MRKCRWGQYSLPALVVWRVCWEKVHGQAATKVFGGEIIPSLMNRQHNTTSIPTISGSQVCRAPSAMHAKFPRVEKATFELDLDLREEGEVRRSQIWRIGWMRKHDHVSGEKLTATSHTESSRNSFITSISAKRTRTSYEVTARMKTAALPGTGGVLEGKGKAVFSTARRLIGRGDWHSADRPSDQRTRETQLAFKLRPRIFSRHSAYCSSTYMFKYSTIRLATGIGGKGRVCTDEEVRWLGLTISPEFRASSLFLYLHTSVVCFLRRTYHLFLLPNDFHCAYEDTYTGQKAKSKYRNRIRLERASQKQSSDTHKTPYDRGGKTGDPRDNPLTSGIVRHDSHILNSGDPAGD
ncbi:hypothetical protein PR048_009913 [Dryococelus australis]|uniref:Uncharacterized protein n=1 Tax=Dryococelus australis TaxID=614101 RepID=A0ABQ9I166_9NEOP|nr:hypothetical protein PR048_009913 [Dryococelus australis]